METDHFGEDDGLLMAEAEKQCCPLRTTRSLFMDWRNLAICCLTLSNGLLLILSFLPMLLAGFRHTSNANGMEMVHEQIAVVPPIPLKPVAFHWNTAYSSVNDTESDVLWNSINTAHGHIAVDHRMAANRRWLPSMPVPGSEEKGLYLLESYHQLHCLKIVRKVFLESIDNQSLSYPVQHVRHCFDYFRQFIMCHADNTPLYTLGKHTSGDGQVHMCKSWSALRDYATENSACFKDRVGQESLQEQFGHCDDGTDGLENVA